MNTKTRTNQMGGCYKIDCSRNKSSYKVYTGYDLNEHISTCHEAGQRVTTDSGRAELTCQDPAIICKKSTTCVDDCNFRWVGEITNWVEESAWKIRAASAIQCSKVKPAKNFRGVLLD